MKPMIEMNTQERRQYERDTVDAIMAARQVTTTTRQLPATGKRTVAIGRSVEGSAFVVTCCQTMQPEPA